MDLETEEHNKAVGRRIREERLKLGLTSDEFGKLFTPPASKGTISKWENGSYLPNNERLKQIANLGNITVDELLNDNPLAKFTNEELLNELNRRLSH